MRSKNHRAAIKPEQYVTARLTRIAARCPASFSNTATAATTSATKASCIRRALLVLRQAVSRIFMIFNDCADVAVRVAGRAVLYPPSMILILSRQMVPLVQMQTVPDVLDEQACFNPNHGCASQRLRSCSADSILSALIICEVIALETARTRLFRWTSPPIGSRSLTSSFS